MESIIDFGDSFLSWKIYGDFHGRVCAECVITKGSSVSSEKEQFIFGSGVLACKVLSGENMITEPSYFYHPFLSEKQFKIFRHGKSLTAQDDQGYVADRYNSVVVDIKRIEGNKLLNEEAVIDAAIQNRRISAVLKLISGEDYYVLQFPAKHVYYHSKARKFQIETGPVMLPSDVANIKFPGSWNICYIAFNTFERLEYAMLKNNIIDHLQYQEYGPVMDLKTKIDVYSSL